MRLLSVYDVFSGCSWYRSVIPAEAAARAGHEVRVAQGALARADIEWCDVMEVQRLWHPQAREMLRYARSLGKRTVYDVDDDLWAIRTSNPGHDFWAQNSGHALDILRESDVVTTTGDEIAATLSRWHDDVRIVPNAVADDFRRWGGDHTPPLAIGWAGGTSHREDLAYIERTLYRVLDQRPVVLALVGHGDWMQHDRIVHLATTPIEMYHKVLSTFDIGIAPLVDNRFNRAKSDLKALEYAAVGVPSVASAVGPYKNLDRGVVLADTPAEFEAQLLRLIDDADLRARMTSDGLAWAATRRISQVLPQWESVWRE